MIPVLWHILKVKARLESCGLKIRPGKPKVMFRHSWLSQPPEYLR